MLCQIVTQTYNRGHYFDPKENIWSTISEYVNCSGKCSHFIETRYPGEFNLMKNPQ